MKIKKFDNLWTMGLIIFGCLLAILYLLKLIVPESIVGVAEIPQIVEFGNYVDSHDWAYYLFTFATSFLVGYFYCGASCRIKKLKNIHLCIITAQIILIMIFQKFIPQYYIYINSILTLVCPMLICYIEKQNNIKSFYSTIICFSIYIIAQILALEIRGIGNLVQQINSATYFILLIDMYIWQILLYNYYNYKEDKK